MNSTTMSEGLQTLPQPPWYCGYNNQVVPPDANALTAASRYGFRGAKNIQQFNTKPFEPPSHTRTDFTPKFLQSTDEYVNEYVPPIFAAKFNSLNGFETPKLWPENSEYVHGFAKKKPPTSWKYKRQTTVDLPERPKSPKLLSVAHSKAAEQSKLLNQYAKMESKNSIDSLPFTAKSKFESEWNAILKKDASKVLKQSLKRQYAPHVTHSLLDVSDSLLYTKSTSIIVHTKSTDELKFCLRMEKTKSKVHTPFTLKWNHVIGHFDNINHQLKKHQTMSDAIQKIAHLLKQMAIKNGSETSLNRIEFIQACSLIHYFEGVSEKQLSQLFSIFDSMKKNSMRFVEFILLLVVLDNPEEEPIPKLQSLWNYAYQYGNDRNILDLTFDLLTTCVGSINDLTEMERLFRTEFRAKCYDFAIKERRGIQNAQENANEIQHMTSLFEHGSKISSTFQQSSAITNATSQPQSPSVTTPTARSAVDQQTGSFVQHQYNICEHYLDSTTFGLILKECPETLQAFDKQLSAKLILCYGKDDRYKSLEEEFVPTENLDFTWIIKKAPPKKATFGLFETQEVE
jgi:hypothetical protein